MAYTPEKISSGSAFSVHPAVWWFLAVIGLSIRLAFVFKGNIAFNSDEAASCLWIKRHMAERVSLLVPPLADFKGLRLWVGSLFYLLSGGWDYFGSLAAIFITSLFSIFWVFWVRQRVSEEAALATALALALPPVCIAYFATHMERRIETLFWASLMVAYSGSWLSKNWSAFLLGTLVGWACWCEPFILFFAVPVAIFEERNRKRTASPVLWTWVWVALGLFLGGTSGFFWNVGYKEVFLDSGLSSMAGIVKNLGLLVEAFPQFWNGNLPFGYLQASNYGQGLDPAYSATFAGFLAVWTLLTFGAAIGGFVKLTCQKNKDGLWLAGLGWIPAALFLLFFVFSAQTWDATSFRYLAYWVIFVALGWGLLFHFLFRRRRMAAIFILSCFALTQCFLLAKKYRQLPDDFPAVTIVHSLERLSFKAYMANHWLAQAGTYLSDGKVEIIDCQQIFGPEEREKIKSEPKMGLVVLEGLDRAEIVQREARYLSDNGYHYAKTWPMLGGWLVIEFDRVNKKT